MLKDFKEFVMRGNVIDLAVGVIIGGAFGKIITSLVNDVLMPPIGLLLGKVDFSNLYINISGGHYASLAQARQAGAVTINYGLFLNTVIDFIIVAFVIYLLVHQMNKWARPSEEKPAASQLKECPFCLTAIPRKATRCPACTSQIAESK